jgi:DUF1365 family protein
MYSCLYTGYIEHIRYFPKEHRFKKPIFMSFIDLDELDKIKNLSPYWSFEKWNIFSFFRKDYFKQKSDCLKTSLYDFLYQKTGIKFNGPIRVLTQVRFLGFIMNPVTFYYCYDSDKTSLKAIVAEINNTPWNERYSYLIHPFTHKKMSSFKKNFHVSPFMGMDQIYEWCFSTPEKHLMVHMHNIESNKKIFQAQLQLNRENLSSSSIRSIIFRYPFMTFKIIFLIYAHAAILKLKGVPFFSHPKHLRSAS